MSLTKIYAKSFVSYWQQARALLVPGIAIFLVVGIPLGYLSQVNSTRAVDIVLGLLSGLLGTATVILYTGYIDEVADDARKHGGKVAIMPTIRQTLPVVWPLTLASLLYVAVVAGGLLLLVIPGFILAARFGLVSTVISLERKKVRASMKESWAMTRGHSLLAMATIVVPLLVESAASSAAEHLGSSIAANETVGHLVGDAVASTIVAPLVGLLMAHTYFALRAEG